MKFIIKFFKNIFQKKDKAPLQVGKTAPDFQLRDQNKVFFQLKEHIGQNIVLSFFPFAWKKSNERQILDLDNNYSKFLAHGSIPVAIGVVQESTNEKWAKTLRLKNLRLLSDFWPHGLISKEYNVFRKTNGYSEKANIIIDKEGKILYTKIYKLGEIPDIDKLIYIIKKHKD